MWAGPQLEDGVFAVKSEACLGTRNAHRCPKPLVIFGRGDRVGARCPIHVQAIQEVNGKLKAGTFRRVVGNKVVTTLEPATDYYIAEDYHQQVRRSPLVPCLR